MFIKSVLCVQLLNKLSQISRILVGGIQAFVDLEGKQLSCNKLTKLQYFT